MSSFHAVGEDDLVICTNPSSITISSTISTLGRVLSAASSVVQDLFLYIVIGPSSLWRRKEIALLGDHFGVRTIALKRSFEPELCLRKVQGNPRSSMSTSQMQNAHPGKLGKLSERDGAQASATTIEDMWNCRSGHRHPLNTPPLRRRRWMQITSQRLQQNRNRNQK